MKIDKTLIKPKLLYFLFMSVVSSLLIYCNIFLMQKGLNEIEIGMIDTVCFITGFLLRPICGMLADTYQAYRSVLLVLMALTAIGFDCLLLLPQPVTVHLSMVNSSITPNYTQLCVMATNSIVSSNETQVFANLCGCSFGKAKQKKFSLAMSAHLTDQCPIYSLDEAGIGAMSNLGNFTNRTDNLICQACQPLSPMVSWSSTFLLALLFKLVGLSAYSPLLCLLDAITFSLLGSRHNKFGVTRMFGSLGFFVLALVTGFALYGANNDWNPTTDYRASFALATVLLALGAIVTLTLKVPPSARAPNPLKALPVVCATWRSVAFYVLVLLAGASFGVFEVFLFVMVEKLLKPPVYYFGILFAVQVIVEAPLFVLSGPIVARIGEPACLVIGFLAFALRFLLTSLVHSHWLLLLVNCLHGLSFGLLFPALLMFAARNSPEGWQGTVQGLVSGLYFGVGQSLCGPTTGAMIRLYGSRIALKVCAGLSLLFAFLALFYLLALRQWPDPPRPSIVTSRVKEAKSPRSAEMGDPSGEKPQLEHEALRMPLHDSEL